MYSHFDILDRMVQKENSPEDQLIAAYIENENPVHRAAASRDSEVNFLRCLTKALFPFLLSRSNHECKVFMDLLKEILTCAVLTPLMDVVADPATINSLVILATNPKVQMPLGKKSRGEKVILLENFVKQFEMSLSCDSDEGQHINGNFLKEQEKLYSFMQHLKSKSNTDIELLKFYLDVEHLNSELDKSNVICDPSKLSELQQKSEKLLLFYQSRLFQVNELEKKPNDLLEAHDHARRILEAKWRNEFYKSAEYFQLIYGDRENSHIPDITKVPADHSDSIHHQKFSSKLKSVMSIRTGAVEGLEATEIPIWDAMDHPLGHTSYYNSVAVKLRKERGQDLDGFMLTFFHSIEQEADMGEDIASTQSREEKDRKKKNLSLGNVELYKNLFNIAGQQPSASSGGNRVKTTVDSAIYFLASILNANSVLLRILFGFLRLLPDGDNVILQLMRKFLNKTINQQVLAILIHELEEKIFNTKQPKKTTNEELRKRYEQAFDRLEGVNKNLGKVLSYLQYPVLNKQLVYCLIDVIIVEVFPEFNLDAKD